MMARARGASLPAALTCAVGASCSLALIVPVAPLRAHAHRPAHRCSTHAHSARHRRCRPRAHAHPLERKPSPVAPIPAAPIAAGQPAGAPAPPAPGGQQPPAGRPVSEPAPVASRAQVTAVEYKLTLSRTQVNAGTTTIELIDGGQDEHNLHVRSGAGGRDIAAFPTIKPGQHVDEHIELAPGTYTFYCSLPGHEALGMKATFTVGAAAFASRARPGPP